MAEYGRMLNCRLSGRFRISNKFSTKFNAGELGTLKKNVTSNRAVSDASISPLCCLELSKNTWTCSPGHFR